MRNCYYNLTYHNSSFLYVSLICDNSVTTQNLWFFRRNF